MYIYPSLLYEINFIHQQTDTTAPENKNVRQYKYLNKI